MCLCVSATHDYMCSSNQAPLLAISFRAMSSFIRIKPDFTNAKRKTATAHELHSKKKTKYYFENFEILPLNQMEIYQPPSHPETYSKCFTNGKENQGSEKNTPLQIIPNRIVGLSWVLFSNFNVYARNCLSKVINVLCVRFRFTFSP